MKVCQRTIPYENDGDVIKLIAFFSSLDFAALYQALAKLEMDDE